MNWVLILVLIILIAAMIEGYAKGFLRIAFSLVSFIVIIVLVGALTPQVTSYLKDNTGFYQKIQENCQKRIETKLQEQSEEPEDEAQVMEISGIKIPSSISKNLLKGMAESKYGGETLVEKTANGVADMILQGIAYFITLIFAILIMKIIGGVLDIISKIPVLKGINRVLGLLTGFVKGLLIIWLAALLLTIFCTNAEGQNIVALIYQNPFLTYLYEHNGITFVIGYIL